jgi:Glycosyltransferase family 87
MQSVAAAVNGRSSANRSVHSSTALRALGIVGLLAVVASIFGVVAGAAGSPTPYVPARIGGWPGWLSGPLHGLGFGIDSSSFQILTLVMCAGYAAALLAARALSGKAIALAILAANLLLLLGPPLISQDVFGYLEFARLGVLHGLDPYTHVAAEAPTDAVFPFIGWPFQHSPYGPLFTLGTYPLAWLGLGGGLWALKLLAVASSLGAVALTAGAAREMGHSANVAAVFVGLNPVLLGLAVGGAHNDTLVLLILAAALALASRKTAMPPARAGGTDVSIDLAESTSAASTSKSKGTAHRPSGGADNLRATAALLVVGIGVKASAGLVLPFVLLAPGSRRERGHVAASALAALVLLALVAVVGFGTHAFGFLGALGEQQQLTATHSLPAETARWVGLSGLPAWWRDLFVTGFLIVLALTLWRTAKGADWRAMAGWATLALLLSTAWLLPWYAIWVLPLAALADSRRLRVATLLFCAYAILIHLPLAGPLLSPPRHIARHPVHPSGRSLADGCGAGRNVLGTDSRTLASDDVVFAGLQVECHTAFDLRGGGFGAQAT